MTFIDRPYIKLFYDTYIAFNRKDDESLLLLFLGKELGFEFETIFFLLLLSKSDLLLEALELLVYGCQEWSLKIELLSPLSQIANLFDSFLHFLERASPIWSWESGLLLLSLLGLLFVILSLDRFALGVEGLRLGILTY